MVQFGCNQILLLKFQYLEVVLVGLPYIVQVRFKCLLHICLLQLGIFNVYFGIASLPAGIVAVKDVYPKCYSKICPNGCPVVVGPLVVFVEGVSVTGIESQIWVGL